MPSWVYWVFAGQAAVIIGLLIYCSRKKEEIAISESRRKHEIDAITSDCTKRITEKQASDEELAAIRSQIAHNKALNSALVVEQNDLLSDISRKTIELNRLNGLRGSIKSAPLDVTFAKNGMPVFWKPDMYKPYGDYTVFFSSKSDIYHTDRFCSGYRAREEHIFNVIGHARPCKKCAEGFFDFTKVPDWYTSEESIFDDPSVIVNWRDQ